MAVATEEITEQTMNDDTQDAPTNEPTNIAEGRAKRARVDVNAVASENPNEKLAMSLPLPAAMLVEVKTWAEKSEVSPQQFVRDLVAAHIGYEVPAEFNERKARASTVGMSKEERAAALAKTNEAKRDNVSNLLAAIGSGAISHEQLIALGINPDLLPKPRGKKKNADGTDSDEDA